MQAYVFEHDSLIAFYIRHTARWPDATVFACSVYHGDNSYG